MTKPSSIASKSTFTGKDAEALIATYGQALTPDKKAKLMTQLQAERTVFEKNLSQAAPSQGKKSLGRERG